MAELKEITSEDAFSPHISALPPTSLFVVYFHAPWAQPCKQMSAVLEALASTYPADGSISFVSVNAEELSSVAEDYNVTAVPFVVLQKSGQTLETCSGSDAAKVRSAVEKHASKGAVNGFSLPPAQKVTKQTEDKFPTTILSAPAAAAPSSTDTAAATKDMSSYVPSEKAPQTAPEMTSAEVDKEALFTRLGQLVKAAPVMLFMKGTPSAPQCGFSRQTVALLRERSIRYGFFNILADDDVRQGLKEFSDWPTFPQLYVDGELVGGLDIVKEEFANDTDFLMQYSVNTQKPDGAAAVAEKLPQAV